MEYRRSRLGGDRLDAAARAHQDPPGSGGIAAGYFCALFVWYAVQVHQTKVSDRNRFQRRAMPPGRWGR